MLQFYKALILIHVEYCAQFWSPCSLKIVDLEMVHKEDTMIMPEIQGIIYVGRSDKFRLLSQESEKPMEIRELFTHFEEGLLR